MTSTLAMRRGWRRGGRRSHAACSAAACSSPRRLTYLLDASHSQHKLPQGLSNFLFVDTSVDSSFLDDLLGGIRPANTTLADPPVLPSLESYSSFLHHYAHYVGQPCGCARRSERTCRTSRRRRSTPTATTTA